MRKSACTQATVVVKLKVLYLSDRFIVNNSPVWCDVNAQTKFDTFISQLEQKDYDEQAGATARELSLK